MFTLRVRFFWDMTPMTPLHRVIGSRNFEGIHRTLLQDPKTIDN